MRPARARGPWVKCFRRSSRTAIYVMIIPGDQVDAAVNRVPAGGNLVLQLLALNHDRHGLAADLQHDHLARTLTRNIGQPREPRRRRGAAVGLQPGVAAAARVRGHAGLRARPPIIQPFAGSSATGSSGRHCAAGTSPGSMRSRPSKNARMSGAAGGRPGWRCWNRRTGPSRRSAGSGRWSRATGRGSCQGRQRRGESGLG